MSNQQSRRRTPHSTRRARWAVGTNCSLIKADFKPGRHRLRSLKTQRWDEAWVLRCGSKQSVWHNVRWNPAEAGGECEFHSCRSVLRWFLSSSGCDGEITDRSNIYRKFLLISLKNWKCVGKNKSEKTFLDPSLHPDVNGIYSGPRLVLHPEDRKQWPIVTFSICLKPHQQTKFFAQAVSIYRYWEINIDIVMITHTSFPFLYILTSSQHYVFIYSASSSKSALIKKKI